MMIDYIDTYRDRFGVEAVCCTLNDASDSGLITSRGYRAAKKRAPSARSLSDSLFIPELIRVHEENFLCLWGSQNVACDALRWF